MKYLIALQTELWVPSSPLDFNHLTEAGMNKILRLGALILGAALLLPALAQNTKFTATLSGSDQVPAVDSSAKGEATFRLNAAGDSLTYTISVTDIEDASAAHIHLAAMGKNGPPVVALYPTDASPSKAGKYGGVLAKGTITAASLIGPLSGKTIADLVEQINAGNTYVNVHSKAHPGGEIRGQLK
jgi:hypothetical protein